MEDKLSIWRLKPCPSAPARILVEIAPGQGLRALADVAEAVQSQQSRVQ